jgi:hypothetical protein
MCTQSSHSLNWFGPVKRLSLVGLLLGALSGTAGADAILDAPGDFLSTYTGAQDAGLDVLEHEVRIAGDRLIFSARMAGPIAATQAVGGVYVTGLNRGPGTPRFLSTPPSPPTIGPNVLFDSVLAINPIGTGAFVNLIAGTPPMPLNPADITISGNEYVANLPLSVFLPGATTPPGEWTYNLWPRNGQGLNVQVADLAPDDGNSAVVPEPASLVLCGMGAISLLAYGWRRRG